MARSSRTQRRPGKSLRRPTRAQSLFANSTHGCPHRWDARGSVPAIGRCVARSQAEARFSGMNGCLHLCRAAVPAAPFDLGGGWPQHPLHGLPKPNNLVGCDRWQTSIAIASRRRGRSEARMDILISGAGIAGLTTAHWLRRYGFRPTIVERTASPLTGGYKIDVRGTALEVLRRMG